MTLLDSPSSRQPGDAASGAHDHEPSERESPGRIPGGNKTGRHWLEVKFADFGRA